MLTPKAVLEPVEINGVIVKNATLHNFDYIAEKDIRPGDRVLVKRAGEVIPYVIGPVVELRSGAEKRYTPPSTCPACGQPVEHFEGEVAWYCVNAACPAQLVRNVEHFVSKGAMDITGLGIKIVEKLIETGLVKDVADIYTLKREDILEAVTKKDRKTDKEPPGKIADNLLTAIEISRRQPLNRLITALGIHGVGEVSAADLSRHFPSLDQLSSGFRGTVADGGRRRSQHCRGHRGLVQPRAQPEGAGKVEGCGSLAGWHGRTGVRPDGRFIRDDLCRDRHAGGLQP